MDKQNDILDLSLNRYYSLINPLLPPNRLEQNTQG